MLLTGLFFGCIFAIPILFTELYLLNYAPKNIFFKNLYTSFIVASFTEEFFKFLAVFLLIWRNKNFNERFDAIVYSVFISLGFAGIENYLFVSNSVSSVLETSFMRSIISVPAHFFYGVFMGYYLSYAKFNKDYYYFFISILVPIFIHGLFDFIIISNFPFNIGILVIFLVFLGINSFFKMIFLLDKSPFKNI